MNLGLNKSVLSKLQKFQREYITASQMREMVLDTYSPFKIQSYKKNGTRITREVFSVFGPGGRAMSGVQYWKAPYNYMILFDTDKSNFRTFRLDFVTWIEKDGKRYYVRD